MDVATFARRQESIRDWRLRPGYQGETLGRKTCKCEFCGTQFPEGNGVDHELNEKDIVEFCSIDHFKAWIDKRMEGKW